MHAFFLKKKDFRLHFSKVWFTYRRCSSCCACRVCRWCSTCGLRNRCWSLGWLCGGDGTARLTSGRLGLRGSWTRSGRTGCHGIGCQGIGCHGDCCCGDCCCGWRRGRCTRTRSPGGIYRDCTRTCGSPIGQCYVLRCTTTISTKIKSTKNM